jgi:NAD(P)-dependent dehydrogenase (short-subunit alcohol dehydrogenase family)
MRDGTVSHASLFHGDAVQKGAGMELKGRTAIVTGAGTGVGRELAIAFARAGANVVCCGRRAAKLQETLRLIEEQGGTGRSVSVDVTDWDGVRRMAETTREAFGRIDVLFNNAGSFRWVGPVWEADPEVWWQDVKTNLLGSMLCCRAVLPHMIREGSGVIVTMDGGGGSLGPNVGGSAYGCSKAALLRFTEGLAAELEREGHPVLAFCMMPGFVRSEMTDYLVGTPERKKWQSHVETLYGSPAEFPPDACAKATMKLLAIAGPELNGRIFYVDTDFRRIRENAARIREQDLYVMHRVTLRGVQREWPLPDSDTPVSSSPARPHPRPSRGRS